jgi:methionine aminopeptidase
MVMEAGRASFVKGMEKAGKLAAETLQYVRPYIKPGITTN